MITDPKLELTVTLTQSKLNQYVIAGLKGEGKGVSTDVDVTVIIIPDAIPIPTVTTSISSKTPSTAPIGKTIDGFELTHYGYPGDSSPDSNSMKGIGDRGKLVPNLSVALTQSARQKLFGVAKPSTGKQFTLSDGTQGQDDDQAPEKNMRIDFYDPYYTGRDEGCTDEMYAKSLAEMKAAGILT